MKYLLKNNYNLESPIISKLENNTFLIKNNNDKYIFNPIDNYEEIEIIANLLQNIQNFKNFHTIEKNIMGNYIVYYRKKPYVLLKVTENKQNGITQIINAKIRVDNPAKYQILDRSNWFFLWSKKNDYMSSNIVYNSKNNAISESYDYFIGLAECAISYINSTEYINKQKELYITHKRVDDHNLNNPLNIAMDRKERDVAEYIKHLFIQKQLNSEKLENIIYVIKRKEMSHEHIYARLLYPTYYFDICDEIQNDHRKEMDLLTIINRIVEYEQLLSEIQNRFFKIKHIKKIDWL